ncbi:MAG TPA: hypothetical protein VEY09_04620 [Pyrinomonadaceae bacterium]|nr:hypothetical protein [Pyrinomonadaceae bacterium]
MPFALLLALAAVGGATTLTYLYDRGAPLWWRLSAGVCVGFAALGLVGFVPASFWGMTPWVLAASGAAAGAPLLLLLKGGWRGRLAADAARVAGDVRAAFGRRGVGGAGMLVMFAALAVVFWLVFANAMYRDGRGVFTGLDTNIGDLPFHVALVTGFAHGENFPPEHPEMAGVKLTYPFVADFVTAMFVSAGATLEGAFFWQGFLTMMAVAGLLYGWAARLTGDRAASVITVLLVLLSGGFGWLAFAGEAVGGRGLFALLADLPRDYTRDAQAGYAWANAVTALFVPQRGILLGVGLALVAWTLWWEDGEGGKGEKGKGEKGGEWAGKGRATAENRAGAERPARGAEPAAAGVTKSGKASRLGKSAKSSARTRDESDDGADAERPSSPFPLFPFFPFSPFLASPRLRRMLAAGLVVGLLPLVHAHSFVVMMGVGACLALLELTTTRGRRAEAVWRWAMFAGAALLIALPQVWWATSGSEVQAGRFFGWEFGWDHGRENVVWFWLKNTGVFIPLLLAALLWRGPGAPVPERLLYFYLPFVLCFVGPNLFKLSPWVWDNIKILLYWWIASAPLVALVLTRLWRAGGAGRAAALALVFAQTLAGGLDVWRAASGAAAHQTFDARGLAFAELVKAKTEPRALILHAPTYNDPVYLTGRRAFLGYAGHLWSHGLDYSAREADLKAIYAGGPGAARLLSERGIDYAVVGPLVRDELARLGVAVNEKFFERFEKVGEVGEYRLYKTRP